MNTHTHTPPVYTNNNKIIRAYVFTTDRRFAGILFSGALVLVLIENYDAICTICHSGWNGGREVVAPNGGVSNEQ